MFGYVRPILNRLSEEDKEVYQSAYCGLCHSMGRRHGALARFTLNYDFTLLAILHYSTSACDETHCRRCPAHPFRKPKVCLCGDQLDCAADESMILFWHKLSDDVKDHSFLLSVPARILRFFLKRGYARASKARPGFDACVRQQMARLSQFESDKSPQLDRVADTFASILAAAADDFEGDSAKHRAMKGLLYHLGRWIYLVDAWDDLNEDISKGRYNPLNARFAGDATGEREYIETTMTHSVRLIHAAANLLEFGRWTLVIDNILYNGIPTVQKAVLDGRWKQLQKQGRRMNERPL